ncbi:MAG: hydrogenase formation protein HypD [Leptospiraceae bacterium]|nr:hydrogenase formation protein HypD [Leptospiraceae bacterium]MDW7976347.1 hydrogenase formation protein HypD [Leptospiraceae bacterium]
MKLAQQKVSIHEAFFKKERIQGLVKKIQQEVQKDRIYRIMEFCGGHTHSLLKFGILDILPENVQMIHGPGCPVCVLAMERINLAIELAKLPNVILCSYGDVLRVPGSKRKSLLHLKAEGYNIKMVYSPLECLEIAKKNPEKEVVFFAIGFETTTPPTAVLVQRAREMMILNLSVVSNHVLTPAALHHLLSSSDSHEEVQIDAFIGPGHVSTVIGYEPFEDFVEKYKKPIVISGFEPEDLLLSILYLIRALNDEQPKLMNELIRSVKREGNLRAKQVISEVFELRESFRWRGLGEIPFSGLRLQKKYEEFDAEKKFQKELEGIPDILQAKENKACICGRILKGLNKPYDCPVFGKVCTPENPLGSCMVSSEGACAAYYLFKFG